MLEFKPAARKSIPLLISVAGVSGSGKTFSALLLAAGIAGPGGKVGGIDTESGRMSLYCDSPTIKRALPGGFSILQLDPPFSPARYVEAIQAAERAGLTVLIIDSVSHEWEGTGGACEIAETKKLRGMPNWSAAKLAHKKFVNCCLSTPLHIIFCVRARDKVKIVEVNGKTEVVPLGIMPITEKSFIFEQTLSFQLDERSHLAVPMKVPEPLMSLFPEPRLLTVTDGEAIAKWNAGGVSVDPAEQLLKRARAAAEEGTEAYRAFFSGLTATQKKALPHEELKAAAVDADKDSRPIFQQFETLEAALLADAEYAEVAGVQYQLVDGNYKTYGAAVAA